MHGAVKEWGLHLSSPLATALLEDGSAKGSKSKKDPNWSDVWLARPISEPELRYASSDAALLRVMYDHLRSQPAFGNGAAAADAGGEASSSGAPSSIPSRVPSDAPSGAPSGASSGVSGDSERASASGKAAQDRGPFETALLAASARYANYFALRPGGVPARDDTYCRHALLPLGILEVATPEFPGEKKLECAGCGRQHASSYFNPSKSQLCAVCAAVSMRHKRKGKAA